jgi:hypothetical protein
MSLLSYIPGYCGLYRPNIALPENLPGVVKTLLETGKTLLPLFALHQGTLDKLTIALPIAQFCSVPFLPGSVGAKVWLVFRNGIELIARVVANKKWGAYTMTKEAPLFFQSSFNVVDCLFTFKPGQDFTYNMSKGLELITSLTYMASLQKKDSFTSQISPMVAEGALQVAQIALVGRTISQWNGTTSTYHKVVSGLDLTVKVVVCFVRFAQAWRGEYVGPRKDGYNSRA